MIEIEKQYKLTLTEDQARQLYNLLKLEKDRGHMTTDHDIILVYNELRPLFDNGIR
jgi:hypothetical protein